MGLTVQMRNINCHSVLTQRSISLCCSLSLLYGICCSAADGASLAVNPLQLVAIDSTVVTATTSNETGVPSARKPSVSQSNDSGDGSSDNYEFMTPADKNWMDSSHHFLTKRSDKLVRWLDGFFGTPRSDLESAQSFLRLRLEHEWDQEDANSVGVRLRGKVLLPRINKRIGLIFSDERGDETGNGANVEQALSDNNPKNDIALQYTSIDKDRSRLDFKLGLRSSFKVKAAARYRYELPIMDNALLRFSEEFYYRGDDGFGSFSRFDVDKTVGNSSLFRWSNRFDYGQETRGVEWGSTISLARRINDESALSYFINVEGETNPGYVNKGYGLGVTYRKNFFRKWLFFELEPAYVWRRRLVESPNNGELYYKSREDVARFTARLEILFGEDQLK